MNYKTVTRAAMAAFLSLSAIGTFAQGPVGDQIKVTFDRSVQVGSQTLPAGDYTVNQVTSASNPRVLEFKTDDNKLVATVTAIPVLLNTPPSETKVVLQDEGGGARLSRILVQGKTYGYGFPGSAMPASQATTASAQLTGSYAGAATETAVSANRAVETPVTPAETPAAATPAPTPAPAAEPPVQQPAAVSANPVPAPTPEVPATGLGWADVVALGLTMTAAGLLLSRRSVRRS